MRLIIVAFEAFLAIIAYKIFVTVKKSRRNKQKALERGCEEIPSYPHPAWDPLGLKMVLWFHQTRIDQKLPPACIEAFDRVSSHEHRKVDTLMVHAVGSSRLWTSDPKNIEALQSSQFKDFELSPVRCGNFEPLLGRGVFNTNGKEWSYHRAMSRPTFTARQIEDLSIQETHFKEMLRALPVDEKGWTSNLDLQTVLLRFTMDIITDFLFDESANSQLNQLPTAAHVGLEKSKNPVSEQEFTRAWDVAQQALIDRFQFFEAFWIWNPPSFRKACRTCHEFVDYYVRLALNKPEAKLEDGKKYIFLNELVQQTRDPKELRAGMINMLQAGRDSTGSTLGWLFLCLARDPAIFHPLREEILQRFGTDTSDISCQALKSCTYLQHCIQEAMRLYPAVPVNATRTALHDTTFPRGGGADGQSPVFVAKGTAIDFVTFRTHRDPSLWGEDADQFRPERFEGKRVGWEYIPFNGGPRACLGQNFALATVGYTTVRLLQTFDSIENMDDSDEVLYNANLTMRSGTGVQVRLHKAS